MTCDVLRMSCSELALSKQVLRCADGDVSHVNCYTYRALLCFSPSISFHPHNDTVK